MPGSRRTPVSTGLLLAIAVLPAFIALVIVLVGIVALALRGESSSPTLNSLAYSLTMWVVGGGLYGITRDGGPWR